MFNHTSHHVSFSEIPNEVSLIYTISGCKLQCKGCHSPELWNENNGINLNNNIIDNHLKKYKNMVTCICFFGGDWNTPYLSKLLDNIKKQNIKTALYTGSEYVNDELYKKLDYLKTGPYKEELGGIESITSNQKLYRLFPIKEDITHLIQRPK